MHPTGREVTPLAEYIVKGGGQNTAHVSTSCAQWVAQKFATYGATRTGWMYEIEAPGGIDVNATARVNGCRSPYLWNTGDRLPGGIQGNHIKKACKYRLLKTGPATKVNSYEALGCQLNRHYQLSVTATR
ncbi:scabin-related ADP-ribosyltransferase [Streptomyces sp. NBC_00442]|uniref:scabin-related ADP-ribosyltransferase n=1 Tax=Streptomyces sp. NBC_00442 TaxID=2903651 RepID=UPI003FA7D6D2